MSESLLQVLACSFALKLLTLIYFISLTLLRELLEAKFWAEPQTSRFNMYKCIVKAHYEHKCTARGNKSSLCGFLIRKDHNFDQNVLCVPESAILLIKMYYVFQKVPYFQ